MIGKGLMSIIISLTLVVTQLSPICPAIADAPLDAGSASDANVLPTWAAAEYPADSDFATNNERISLDFRGVDIRDVLSALAIKMGVDILLVGTESVEISFEANNITPLQALELIIDEQGLSHLQNNGLILVGDPGTLQQNFFDQMILTRFNLYYVPADKIKELIAQLGMEQVVLTVDTNQNLIWVQGTAQVVKKVRELIYAVDTEDALAADDSHFFLAYKTISLTQIPTDRAVELLKSVGVELKHYVQLDNRLLVFDRELFYRWDKIETLAKELDSSAADKRKVFVFQFKNTTAGDAAKRLTSFNFGDEVKTVTYNYEKFGKELLVICPSHLATTVRSSLVSLDTMRQKIRIPVLKANGENAHRSLNAKRNLLSELTGISLASFHISNNLSGDNKNPEYVLWVEETPDNAQLVKDLLEEMAYREDSGKDNTD